jgi:hypothetical protein
MNRIRAASVIATVFTAMLLILAAPQPATAVTSSELIENPTAWDGRTVSFEGESIGELMVRGDMAWLHVNDDAYARTSIEADGVLSGYNSGMAVVLPARAASGIEHFGSYSEQGDIVEVIGVFRAASARHGGEMVIEGQSVRVVEPGYAVEHPVEGWKPWAIAILAPVCGAAGMLLRRHNRSVT